MRPIVEHDGTSRNSKATVARLAAIFVKKLLHSGSVWGPHRDLTGSHRSLTRPPRLVRGAAPAKHDASVAIGRLSAPSGPILRQLSRRHDPPGSRTRDRAWYRDLPPTRCAMPTYRAPLDDIRFVLHDVHGVARLAELPGFEDATPDMVDAVLAEGAKVCEEVLFPVNQSGDAEGCTTRTARCARRRDSTTRTRSTPRAAGPGSPPIPKYGGQGLPEAVRFVFEEMLCSVEPLVQHVSGALARCVQRAHEPRQRRAQGRATCPSWWTASWAGTMCLTEAHAGTDLGIITTGRAGRRRRLPHHRHEDLHLGR